MTKAHQLLPSLAHGDAIGTATLQLQRLLRTLGYRSEIFAEAIDPKLRQKARPLAELKGELSKDDLLIYHLSIGSDAAKLVTASPARTVLFFHNITPPAFFRDIDPLAEYWLTRGHQDLSRLAPAAAAVIAASSFNADEARRSGASRCVIIPPAADLQRLRPRPHGGSSPTTILFVGRAAPNKGHALLIKALAAYRRVYARDCRLLMVGPGDERSPYVRALRRLIGMLGVEKHVGLDTHRLEDRELGDCYAVADAFATASDHEGFCVPVIEAMAFGLPVVARACGALPETVGDAGLLVRSGDPLVWAAAFERVLGDAGLRLSLGDAGALRVADHARQTSAPKLADSLRTIGVTALTNYQPAGRLSTLTESRESPREQHSNGDP